MNPIIYEDETVLLKHYHRARFLMGFIDFNTIHLMSMWTCIVNEKWGNKHVALIN